MSHTADSTSFFFFKYCIHWADLIPPPSLRAITKPQGVLQAPVDTEETMKDFCSQACLSSFNYKRIMSAKIHIKPVASRSQCSVCSRYCIVRDKGTHFFLYCSLNKLDFFFPKCSWETLFWEVSIMSPQIYMNFGSHTVFCLSSCRADMRSYIRTSSTSSAVTPVFCASATLTTCWFVWTVAPTATHLWCSRWKMAAKNSAVQSVWLNSER